MAFSCYNVDNNQTHLPCKSVDMVTLTFNDMEFNDFELGNIHFIISILFV